MQSTVEALKGNKVKVSVQVEEAEFETEVDAAFRRIAREARIPGFRPGKVPRRILEARVGTEAARADALQHSLPDYYAKAVTEHDVDVIAAPEIDITAGEASGSVAFDAVVEVRPRVTIGGYDSLRVTIERPDVADADVDERVDHLREQYADLRSADRAARDGDQVSIDVHGSQAGVALSGLTAEDYLYEVGSGAVVPEMDDQLRGAKVGDILQFTAPHPDPDEAPVDFRILVKDVKEKVLPAAADEWAAESSEFDTIDELRDDIERRLTTVKKVQAQMALQERAAEALADLVAEDIPDALVNAEMQTRLQDLALRLQAQGIELEQYLEATGKDQESFVAELRETATQAVRVDLALRAVAEGEGIEADDEDLEAEYATVAERVSQEPEQVRRQFERNEQVPLVRSDVKKRKALEWLLEQVEVVDEHGQPIDRSALEVTDDGATPSDDADSPSADATEPTGAEQ